MDPPRILLITATDVVPEPRLLARLEQAAALPTEVRRHLAVQLRDPHLSGRDLWALATLLRARTTALGISLIINDRLDVACAVQADGVHLGRRSATPGDARALLGESTWISVTAHSTEEVATAAIRRPDAVVLSPICASPGKTTPLGLDALRRARQILEQQSPRPHLIALGGIDPTNARQALQAGADAVATIRANLFTDAPSLLDH